MGLHRMCAAETGGEIVQSGVPTLARALAAYLAWIVIGVDGATPAPTAEAAGWSMLALCLMALPNFLFALYLLRRIPQNAVTQEQ